MLVRWKRLRENLQILCHPICNRLYMYGSFSIGVYSDVEFSICSVYKIQSLLAVLMMNYYWQYSWWIRVWNSMCLCVIHMEMHTCTLSAPDVTCHLAMTPPKYTHCNTLQHTVPHCNTLQHTSTRRMSRKNAACHTYELVTSRTYMRDMSHINESRHTDTHHTHTHTHTHIHTHKHTDTDIDTDTYHQHLHTW